MARRSSSAVLPLNLGLYYAKSPLTIPPGALQDGRNFRIRNGRISNLNLGWRQYSASLGTNNVNTKLLLHFNGPDTSTRIYDSAIGSTSVPRRVFTVAGNAQIDTASFVFGASSLLLDGTGDYVHHSPASEWALTSVDWTIDCRFNCNTPIGTLRDIAGNFDVGSTAAGSGFLIRRNAAGKIVVSLSDGSTFHFLTGTTIFSNTDNPGWHHVAVVRSGNTISLFLDGILEASDTFVGSVNTSVEDWYIGKGGNFVGSEWLGWLDEFRLTKLALWTANFTPPASQTKQALSGPIMLMEEFVSRGSPTVPIIATTRDIYRYDSVLDEYILITPTFNVGTATVSAATPAVVTGAGAPQWVTNGIKQGDFIQFGSNSNSDPEAEWYEIAAVNSETQLTLTTAVTSAAAFTGVTYSIRRRFTGSISNHWDTETFVSPNDGVGADMIFLTNGLQDVSTYVFGAPSVLLRPSLGFKCKQLRIFKSMMLYGNLTIAGAEFPTSFINSDVGIPLNVISGLAGQFRAHDGVDEIHEMEDLGDNMIFYSERHLTLVQFVGDPLIFIFRQASTGIGPLGPNLVADFGDYHEFLGADSQYLFDGVSVIEVGTQVWRDILRARDASRQRLGFIHFDEENGDLIWAIPLAADVGTGNVAAPPEEAFVEHYLEIEDEKIPDPVSRRQMPFVCGGYAETRDVLQWKAVEGTWEQQTIRWNDSTLGAAFPLNLMGGADGIIYVINVAQNANGAVMPSWVHTGRRGMVEGRNRGLLRRVYPFATQLTGNLQVITSYSDHASGPNTTTEQNLMNLMLPQEGHFVTPYRRGRFYECEFRRDDGQSWEMEGYDVDIIPDGFR